MEHPIHHHNFPTNYIFVYTIITCLLLLSSLDEQYIQHTYACMYELCTSASKPDNLSYKTAQLFIGSMRHYRLYFFLFSLLKRKGSKPFYSFYVPLREKRRKWLKEQFSSFRTLLVLYTYRKPYTYLNFYEKESERS